MLIFLVLLEMVLYPARRSLIVLNYRPAEAPLPGAHRPRDTRHNASKLNKLTEAVGCIVEFKN